MLKLKAQMPNDIQSPNVKQYDLKQTYYGEHQIVYNRNRGHEVFSDVTGGRPLFFHDLSVGETAAAACGGMRRGQESPADKS